MAKKTSKSKRDSSVTKPGPVTPVKSPDKFRSGQSAENPDPLQRGRPTGMKDGKKFFILPPAYEPFADGAACIAHEFGHDACRCADCESERRCPS